MKKSFMSISLLIVSVSMLALFLCSSVANAQASEKFIYNKGENVETVYILDKTGQFLAPKLKYEYTKDVKERGTLKKAYRWNANEQKWIPYYLITLLESVNESIVEYATWDSKSETFSLNSQRAIYNKGVENELLSYASYRWNQLTRIWKIDQHLLLGDYLAINS